MRRLGNSWVCGLCLVLAVHLVPAFSVGDFHPIPQELPVDVYECASESETEENKDRRDALVASIGAADGSTHDPGRSSRHRLAPVARHDDPPGLLSHGLRAPPA